MGDKMNSQVKEIMQIMETISYGFKDSHGNNILDVDPEKWDQEFPEFYFLQTPEELLKSRCGVCWDQVELERKLFTDAKIKVNTYFIYLVDGNDLPSHTFLTFKDNNKYYWFEHSWQKYQGIHEYNSEKELLLDVKNLFKKDHNYGKENSPLYLYKYQKPVKHISCDDFYEYIETQEIKDVENVENKF